MSPNQLRLNDRLRRELGPLILNALENPDVIEIMLNADGRLWTDSHSAGMRCVGEMDLHTATSLLCTIASSLDTEITREKPIVGGELLLDGNRFQGLLPPVVEAPVFAIRKKAIKVYSLRDYRQSNILSERQENCLTEAIKQRQNILVIGATGSGKTTLCNALLYEISVIDPETRIAIIEDTLELQCAVENQIGLRTSDTVGMVDLLRSCLRLRPDRIAVGEVRGAEALALLKAWNTGHAGGVATVHANSAMAGLMRLEQLIQEAGVVPSPAMIAESVNVLVSIQRTSAGRRVEQILKVEGWRQGKYLVAEI